MLTFGSTRADQRDACLVDQNQVSVKDVARVAALMAQATTLTIMGRSA